MISREEWMCMDESQRYGILAQCFKENQQVRELAKAYADHNIAKLADGQDLTQRLDQVEHLLRELKKDLQLQIDELHARMVDVTTRPMQRVM